MAANRFATMLHRNTHRMAFLLIYTVLEWILIALLLLSALLSFLIAKFASFFGLRPPCIFCTRVDHLFQPGKTQRFYKDLICDSHAVEISKLGFCSKHQRLSEAGDMCEDCAASGFGETDRKDRSVEEEMEDEKDDAVGSEKAVLEREIPSAHAEEIEDQEEEAREKEDDSKSEILIPSPCYVVEDALATILAFHPENTVDDVRILPIELSDSSIMVRCGVRGHDVDDGMVFRDAAEQETSKIDIVEIAEKQSFTVTVDDTADVSFGGGNMRHQDDIHVELVPVINTEEFEDLHAYEEESKVNEEVNCEISIGSDICDQEQIEHAQIHESLSEPEFQQNQSLESFNETTDRDIVTEPEPLKRSARQVKYLAIPPVLNEIVEEGMPETPTTPYSIEGFPVLPKRFLLERRESGTESLDGSIASDLDNMEPWTLERLKAALKAERKSLTALYAELEEERSASAIATNQTMAMITRLQEEKAAMQMEALHYQRMMEEQSEYDQEALQVLNELILKREKEKQELEEELELYHEKVLMYESREGNRKTGNESVIASGLSISEDSDDISFEFHEGEESNCNHHESKQNTRSAEILSFVESSDTVDVCLTEFEENRLSILKKLKALVENLFKLDDKDETDDSESRKQCWVENGHKVNGECKLLGDDLNYGSVNCSSHDLQNNGKLHCEQRSAGILGKNLLPLFDAVRLESEEKLSTKDESIDVSSPDSISKFSVGLKKVAIAEELDEVYKRLQALEADRDFIKHCISSMKKGKKGVNLLQEILQNLDALRRVQLHNRSLDF